MKERPASGHPTVDIVRPDAKITQGSTVASAFDPPQDRFEARGELGRGGMGRVDEAFDRALGRDVAIKHMLSHSDVDLARFEREARITARLEHPGIVPIHDAGRSADGTPYYVMRRVDGQPLSDLVGDKPLSERLRLVPNILAACDAAAFAHARGIVHRDIKPTNILVGPFGETLLIDWGLAREMESRELAEPSQPPSDPSVTRAGTVAGTPGFMSPEQARGESVDARADVFALGATLFYVLAGELPWHGGSTEMIDHVGAGRPPDWRRMPGEVPPDLRAIVEKAMAPNLADRYPDATALAADLRQFTVGNLVAAYEYGPIARLVRFMRRHRAAVLVGAISMIVLAVVATISIRRVIAERDDATAARKLAESRQREAAAAADRLLVAHARELAEVDPMAAIAVLRTLRPDSAKWPEAWAAASTAWFRGIPFGFVGGKDFLLVQISADNRHAYMIGAAEGAVTIFDLATRTRRTVGAPVGRVAGAGWFDTTHIVITRETEAFLLDVETGTRRDLGVMNAEVRTNRAGTALLHQGRRLLELDSADGRLIELGHDVDDLTTSPDLKETVVHRGTHRELWVGGRTLTLPDLGSEVHVGVTYAFRENLLVAYQTDGMLTVWNRVGDKLVERGHWMQQAGLLGIGVADNDVVVITPDAVRPVAIPNANSLRGSFTSIDQTRDGFALAGQDGSIWIRDPSGWLKLGKRQARYTRMDVSLDGKFVAAITTTGDVLFWDISKLRPRTLELDQAEVPQLLTTRALWTMVTADAVWRLDFASGAHERVCPVQGLDMTFEASRDEDFAVHFDREVGSLTIAPIGKPYVLEQGIEAFGMGEEDVYFARSDHSLWRWAGGQITRIGTLPSAATSLVLRDNALFVLLGWRDLLRIDLRTGARVRTSVREDVNRLRIDASGRIWLVAKGNVYRWDGTAEPPVSIPSPEPMDEMASLDEGVIIHGPRFLLRTDGTATHLIPQPSRFFTSMGNGLVAVVSPVGVVSVLDVANGATVELPLSQVTTAPLVADGNRIGITYWGRTDGSTLLGMFELDVPRKPAELQQWLRDVTNAKPVPGSEAVAWP